MLSQFGISCLFRVQNGANLKPDSDAWMAEGPEEIEKEMQAHQAEAAASHKIPKSSKPAKGGAAEEGFDPGEFARRMQVRAAYAPDLHH